MHVVQTNENSSSKNKSGYRVLCTSLAFSLVLSMILSIPAWAQNQKKNFEILGRWNSTYGRMMLKYAGTKPDGTEAVAGRWLSDLKEKRVGRILNGEYNRKTGKLWFDYFEPWSKEKGRANFTLSADKSKLVGSYKATSGQSGEWVLDRPVAQSMIVYIPGKTKIIEFGDDDIFLKVIGNDKQQIIIPAGAQVVQIVGGGGKKVVAGAADNANGNAETFGTLKTKDEGGPEITLSIKNDSGVPIRANWVDADGKEGTSEDVIKPGEDKTLGTTYPGHVYRCRETKWNALLKEFRVTKSKGNNLKIVVPPRQAG